MFSGDIVAHLAICGETFRLSLSLPYDDYLPETVLLNFLIRVSFTLQHLISIFVVNMKKFNNLSVRKTILFCVCHFS